MSTRREVLLGAGAALSAGLLGVDDTAPVSYSDADGVRPVNLTGYGTGDGPDVVGLEHLTGFDELEVSTSGTVPTLRVDAETTSALSVRVEAEVSRAEVAALRDEIDAALDEK